MSIRGYEEDPGREIVNAIVWHRDRVTKQPVASGADAPLPALALPGWTPDLQGGRFYLAGSGQLSLAVAGNVRAMVANPADSGVVAYLVRMTTFGTGRSWTTLYRNPTIGLPTTAVRPVLNAVMGPPVPAAKLELRVDTNATEALSGGIATGIVLGAGAERRNSVDLPPFVVYPGEVVGVNVPFAGAADATMNLYWYERLL